MRLPLRFPSPPPSTSVRAITLRGAWLLVGLFLLHPAQAQSTGAVTGQVVDESGEPLPGANVLVEGTSVGAAADRNGRYRLGGVPAGEQTIAATFVGYRTGRADVTVTPGRTSEQDFQLESEAVEAGEIVVESQRDILRTLERKRSATAILDVLDLETLEKLPLQDMVEGLDRLPGVYIQGEGAGRGFRNAFVVIRGIQPDVNNVTVMGMPLVSTTGERGVALDVLPANMASQVEVVKALTPDMDANAIGGTVNIVPLSAFDRQGPSLYASVQGGQHQNVGALTSDELPLDLSLVGSTRLGRSWGVAATANFNQEAFARTFSQPDDWEPIPQAGFPQDLFIPEGTRLEQSQSAFERWSGTVALEWRPEPAYQARLLTSYTHTRDDQTSTQTEWNYADGKDDIAFEMRSPTTVFTPEGENEKEMDLDDQTERLFFTFGTGEFRFGDVTWGLDAGYVRGELDENVEEWSFNSVNFASTIDLSGPIPWAVPEDPAAFNDPANYTFDEIDFEPATRTSTMLSFSTDVRYDVGALGEGGFLKAGALYRPRETTADRDENQYEFNEASGFEDITLAGLGAAMPTEPVRGLPLSPAISPDAASAWIENNPNFLFFNRGASIDDQIEGDYEVDEDVVAGYAMAQVGLGDLELVGGLRVERTRTASFVQTFNEETEAITGETAENDYTNVLPNLHARYRLNARWQARGAMTFTLARPRLSDLAGSRTIDYDNSDIVEPGLVSDADVEQGNPDLDPFRAFNLDATLEFYPRRASFYMGGLFYKRITDPIFTQSVEQNDVVLGDTRYRQVDFEQPINGESESIWGIEGQIQETFTFLPGPLGGLGISANGVYLDSEQQPNLILSLTPFLAWRDLDVRLSYQFTDEYLTGLGSNPEEHTYLDARTTVDVQASYGFLGRYTAVFAIQNLTDEPVRVYQGRTSRTTEFEAFGRSYWLGLRFRL